MARGRKPLPKNYEKLISEVEEKIGRYKRRIVELEQDREAYVQARKKEEMETLYNRVISTGKSVDEIINLTHNVPNRPNNIRNNNSK